MDSSFTPNLCPKKSEPPHFIVRCHYGDNPHSDVAMARHYGIPVRQITDTHLTEWENQLVQNGAQSVALVIREVRLRHLPANASAFHAAVVGEFLAMLLLYAVYLSSFAREKGITHYLFAARDAVYLSRVFRALMPGFDSETIDLNRRLLGSGSADDYFGSRLKSCSVVVDIVSSGRSIGQLCARLGRKVPVMTLVDVSEDPGKDKARAENGFYSILQRASLPEVPYTLEALMDPGYPSVHCLLVDAGSRAVIRVHTPDDQTSQERENAEFVSTAVTGLTDVLQRRALRFDFADGQQIAQLLHDAVTRLLRLRHHIESPSYLAKNYFPQEAEVALA